MATTSIWSIKNNLKQSLNYIINPEKTINKDYGKESYNYLEISTTEYNFKNEKYDVDICISIKNATSSIIEDVTKVIRSLHVYLKSINFREEDFEISRIDIRVTVDSKQNLDILFYSLKNIPGCVNVFRPNSLN